MKKLLVFILAVLMLTSSLASCAPTKESVTASDEAAGKYAAYLEKRDCLPPELVIASGDAAAEYGTDVSSLTDDGYVTRANGGKVVILAKTDAGLDRAVRDYANHGNANAYEKTYGDGYRVKSLTVCGNDISLYAVVRPDDADECLTFASGELVSYIEKTCGASLPSYTESEYAADPNAPEKTLTLAVDYPALGDEAFRLEVKEDGSLTVFGGRYRGCMYGVYELMREVGWVYLNTPAVGSKEPLEYLYESEHVDLTPAINRTESASIANRYFSDYGAISKNTDNMGVKLRNNYVKGSTYGYYGIYRSACHGLEESGCLKNAGVFSDDDVYQPCFTDEDVIDAAIEYALETARAQVEAGAVVGRDLTCIDVAQYDRTYFCVCRNCLDMEKKEHSKAGAVLRFTNAVAEALDEEFPGLCAAMFAYCGTDVPPTITKPRYNTRVAYCYYINARTNQPICCKHSIDDDCPTNVLYREDIEGWKAICTNDNLDIWYYPFNAYSIAFASPHYTKQYRDLKYFTDLGVSGIYVCTGGTKDQLSQYLCARMSWDPDITEEEYFDLIKEWILLNYGEESGELIYEYLLICEEAGQRAEKCWCGFHSCTTDKVDCDFFAARFDYMWGLFNEAKLLAENEWQERMIEQVESGMLYLCIGLTHTDRYLNGTEEEREEFLQRYEEAYRIFTEEHLPVTGYSSGSRKYVTCEFDPEQNPFDAWCIDRVN